MCPWVEAGGWESIWRLFPYPNCPRGTRKREGLQRRHLQGPGEGLSIELTGVKSDFSVRAAEAIACLRGVSGKFCLTAGDFPRRPFDDSFNPLPDSDVTVVFRGLYRRQRL